MTERLGAECLRLPGVWERESRMAEKGTRALCLRRLPGRAPYAAFIDDCEFCHLHPAPEGSLHLTLPAELRERAIELGWAEQHLSTISGVLPPSVVLVYAPRSESELDAVLLLVRASYRFASGGLEEAGL